MGLEKLQYCSVAMDIEISSLIVLNYFIQAISAFHSVRSAVDTLLIICKGDNIFIVA